MTSSLVGSEMCIRDRSAPAPGDRPCAEGAASAERADHGQRARPLRKNSCLLYTSDAADDM
eukprot:10432325-Prorocentrum_lima.AAC.1